MLEVVEFLQDIDQIGESALQRITNIVVRHLSSPQSMLCHKVGPPSSRFLISHDEFLRSLHNFDRRNRDIFLEGLESYLSSIFASTPGNDEPGIEKDFHRQHYQQHQQHPHHHHQQQQASQPILHHVLPNRRPDCFIDAAAAKSSNEILSALRKKDEATVVANLADVITTVIGSQDDNEDLAEADQICNNADDSYATEDDLAVGGCGIDENGAVGGLAMSVLPDLAKVTATPTRNQMDVSFETFLSFYIVIN